MQTRAIFMGSPEFAIPSLKSLTEICEVIGVVTQPDRPAGRGRTLKPPPVKELAQNFNLPIIQPDNVHESDAMKKMLDWQADIIIVAAFGQILKSEILDLTTHGCINVHASLLPRWRGAAPINAAILHGDVETGITIMKMDEGLDTGPILSQEAIPIKDEDNAGALSEKLAELGGKLLEETLPKYVEGKITPQPQNDDLSTYAPMLKKEDGLLDFKQPAKQLSQKVRAYFPWPGTYMHWAGKGLKVHKAHVDHTLTGEVGKTTIIGKMPGVFTPDGILILDEVQPAGKKRMTGKVFLNGARDWGKNLSAHA